MSGPANSAPPRTRSRVGNGNAIFVEADARSAWARRFKDLCSVYADHIGGHPTAPQLALIRRIATLDIESERIEGHLAEGQPVDLDLYNRLAGSQRRLLEQLGFKATARTAVNPLARHFAEPVKRRAAA